jgi:hypothetical protein
MFKRAKFQIEKKEKKYNKFKFKSVWQQAIEINHRNLKEWKGGQNAPLHDQHGRSTREDRLEEADALIQRMTYHATVKSSTFAVSYDTFVHKNVRHQVQ